MVIRLREGFGCEVAAYGRTKIFSCLTQLDVWSQTCSECQSQIGHHLAVLRHFVGHFSHPEAPKTPNSVHKEEKKSKRSGYQSTGVSRVCIVCPDTLVAYLVRYVDLSLVPHLIFDLCAEKTVHLSLCFFIFNLPSCVGCWPWSLVPCVSCSSTRRTFSPVKVIHSCLKIFFLSTVWFRFVLLFLVPFRFAFVKWMITSSWHILFR